MRQGWAMFGMGVWLAGALVVSVVAAENFYTVDRLLAGSVSGTFASLVVRLGQPQTRELLRYLSSELNRFYFQLWNAVSLGVGLLVLWLVSRRPSSTKACWGVVAMQAITLLMMLWLTPAIVSLGRSLDFVPRDPAPPGLGQFWMLHGIYTSLEVGKLILGIIVTTWIAGAAPTSDVLLNHPNRRSRNSGEYLRGRPMGSILSPNGPSDKPGTIQ